MSEQPFITCDSDVELKAVKPDQSYWMFAVWLVSNRSAGFCIVKLHILLYTCPCYSFIYCLLLPMTPLWLHKASPQRSGYDTKQCFFGFNSWFCPLWLLLGWSWSAEKQSCLWSHLWQNEAHALSFVRACRSAIIFLWIFHIYVSGARLHRVSPWNMDSNSKKISSSMETRSSKPWTAVSGGALLFSSLSLVSLITWELRLVSH